MRIIKNTISTFALMLLCFLAITAFSIDNQAIIPKPSIENDQGIVTYKRTTSWKKIAQSLSYLSKEERDRIELTWGSEGWSQNYELRFSPKASAYFRSEEQEEKSTYSWRESDLYLSRNFEEMTRTDWIETMGRTYLIEGELVTPKWKIHNEFKEVAGYFCMRAETRDTIKNQTIMAWFTDQIPSQAGPEMLGGLPGLILELDINDGATLISATKVAFQKIDDFKKPKKMKGKKISAAEYESKMKEHIETSIAGERNPFWGLRY